MSHRVTVQEHPWPTVILHWAHLISFLILAFTGLAIHYKPSGWPMGTIINLHYLNMFVFVCTTIIRIYWAFMGAGSANTGSTVSGSATTSTSRSTARCCPSCGRT